MLSATTIKRLAMEGTGPRISIYLPTHRVGPGVTDEDRLRMKNLIANAARELERLGTRSAEVDATLAPARALLGDVEFWANQGDGLALFLAHGGSEAFRLPLAVEELLVVGDAFHLKPLLPLVGDGRFHLLALSQHRVRLYEGGRESIRELDLGDVPHSLLDVVGYDWEESSLQFHTGAAGGPGRLRAAMFHGDGSPKDGAKDEIIAFLRAVDDGIARLIGDDDAPLVLAAVDYVASAYRLLTKVSSVLPVGVGGNPDRVPVDTLHARAWEIVAPILAARREADADRLRSATATDLVVTELGPAVDRSVEGRIDTLFVAAGTEVWGRPSAVRGDVEVHDRRRPGDRDLLDLVAVRALQAGARVYAVGSGEMPVGAGPVAALLRY